MIRDHKIFLVAEPFKMKAHGYPIYKITKMAPVAKSLKMKADIQLPLPPPPNMSQTSNLVNQCCHSSLTSGITINHKNDSSS